MQRLAMDDPYILVLYYSRYGEVAEIAHTIALGVEETPGITAKIRTVPEVATLCTAHAPAIPENGDLYASLDDLKNCSGLLLGSPTRFGNMAAPLQHFLESTTPLWLAGALAGKPAAVFSSSSSLHGGQESTLLTMMLPLLHHGAVLVGLPYTEAALRNTRSGGSPYGATHVGGLGQATPLTAEEKQLSKALGQRLARIALKINKSTA